MARRFSKHCASARFSRSKIDHAASAVTRGAVTIGVGAAGGLTFFLLNLPLPWVLGSVAASALITQLSPFRPELPATWRSYAMVAIGTMLGTGFTPDVIARAGTWAVSLLAMALLSLCFGLFAYMVFRRWGDMNRETALFAAMPGGLSVVTMLAEQYETETNRVVLCHTARLVVLLISAPLLIQWIAGIDLSAANRTAFSTPEAFDLTEHGKLALIAIASWYAATRIRFPSVMLLLPLLSSAVLHATGLVTGPRARASLHSCADRHRVRCRRAICQLHPAPDRPRWLAGGTGGSGSGRRLSRGGFSRRPLRRWRCAPLFLAYLPGGAPELGVVALALMIDPAMVAAHHVLRVCLIVAILPYAAHRVGTPRTGSP